MGDIRGSSKWVYRFVLSGDEIVDNLKLIEVIAGDEYQVQEATVASCYVLTHKKCGNRFVRSESEISLQGIHCPRCSGITYVRDQVIDGVNEKLATNLCKQCKEFLPSNTIIIGDTSSLENKITVKSEHGFCTEITIQDLISGNNLPDWLQRRTLQNVSTSLQVLDFFVPDRYEILDDFTKLTDYVRIKDKLSLQVQKMAVQDFIKEIINESNT